MPRWGPRRTWTAWRGKPRSRVRHIAEPSGNADCRRLFSSHVAMGCQGARGLRGCDPRNRNPMRRCACGAAGAEDRHLRRARRCPRLDRVLRRRAGALSGIHSTLGSTSRWRSSSGSPVIPRAVAQTSWLGLRHRPSSIRRYPEGRVWWDKRYPRHAPRPPLDVRASTPRIAAFKPGTLRVT